MSTTPRAGIPHEAAAGAKVVIARGVVLWIAAVVRVFTHYGPEPNRTSPAPIRTVLLLVRRSAPLPLQRMSACLPAIFRVVSRAWIASIMGAVAIGLAACSGDPTPPEEQIRQLNRDAEAAAEAKDVGALKDMVSEAYRDVNGYDRSTIVRLVQFYLFRHRQLHLFSLTKSLQVLDEDNAVADILVAMAGRPVENADQLFDVRADLVRFEVRYVREDDEWKVAGAEWRRATADDFL